MSFERLWAPWRLEYVTGSEKVEPPPEPVEWQTGADHDCFLCRAAASYERESAADRKLMIAWRGRRSMIVLNRYPYNNGHILVAPKRHVGELIDMERDEHV